MKLQQKVEKLENRISELGSDLNKKDLYNRRNNTEIQGIPSDIGDDSLEDKVIEILAEVQIVATKSDIEDCHRLGKNGSTCFANDTKIYVSENLTPYNQCLACKCRELKRAKKIHKVWSMKGAIKIRRSPNERAYSINNDHDIRYLFPDFIFKESNNPK